MGRIVATEFVSLDGVMTDPGGSEGTAYGGWTFRFDRGADGDAFKIGELFAADALLLGRRTYESFAAAWPNYTDETGFADKMNSMRKYVVSQTMTDEEATWENTHVLRGDPVTRIAELRAAPGGDLLVAGSRRLVADLAANDLVDEYRLMVFPVILGSGERLFADSEQARRLVLVESRTAGDGVLLLTYHPGGVLESPVGAA
jgi:dihydrofolate reductase